jgi:hypothetical protein
MQISLLFGNVTADDILIKEELDALAAAHPHRFKVSCYLLAGPVLLRPSLKASDEIPRVSHSCSWGCHRSPCTSQEQLKGVFCNIHKVCCHAHVVCNACRCTMF